MQMQKFSLQEEKICFPFQGHRITKWVTEKIILCLVLHLWISWSLCLHIVEQFTAFQQSYISSICIYKLLY